MRKLLLALSTMFLLNVGVAVAEPELNSNHPDRYTVVEGDTLWDISSRFLKNPWLWPEIWHVNQQISNPHLIYPGDVIGLVYIKGQPRLTMLKRNPLIKLGPKVRATPLTSAIPAIPLDAINSFLTDTRIVESEDLEAAPYVLTGRGNHVISGAGDTIFARGDAGNVDTLGVYRKSQLYVDPETEEFLGLEAKSIAKTKVKAVDGEVITLNVLRSNEEIMQGDRLLPSDNRVINSTFHPSSPVDDIRGSMIAVLNGVSQIGQYDVVVINKGDRDAIKEGNVFAVYKKGGLVRDPFTKEQIELPSERAGLVMVFRTYEKVSYGLVLKATRPLAVLDEVRSP